MTNNNKPLILGVTGASGLIYAVRALKFLLAAEYQIELVASKSTYTVWQAEQEIRMPGEPDKQEQFWREQAGVPSHAKLAGGLSSDLLERAADVQIKEGRKLVIVPRETPFSLIHLRNLTTLAETGVRIVPAIPAWYHNPQSIEDLVDFVVARALDQLDIDCIPIERWQGHL